MFSEECDFELISSLLHRYESESISQKNMRALQGGEAKRVSLRYLHREKA